MSQPTATTTAAAAAWPRSRLGEIWKDFEQQSKRIDDMEKRLNETVMRKRRRITNLVDEVPTHRKSHVRVFVHRVRIPDNNSKTPSYCITVEGKLLVGHLDHKRATEVDNELFDGSIKVDVDPSDRSQYRGGSTERDVDTPVEPIQFTHFFDAITLTIQTVWRPTVVETPTTTSTTKTSSSQKRNKKRGQQQQQQQQQQDWSSCAHLLRISPKTVLKWTRTYTHDETAWSGDAHAIRTTYQALPPPTPDLVFYSVVVRIEMVARSPEIQYKPNPALARTLFPQHTNEKHKPQQQQQQQRSKKQANNSSGGSNKKRKTDSTAAAAEVSATNEIPTISNVFVPATLTMKDLASAFFCYIQFHKLMDEREPSVIVCDKTLQTLLECERLNFADLQQWLLTKQLVVDATKDPAEITYVIPETTEQQNDNNNVAPLSLDMDVYVPSLFQYRCRQILRRIKQREFEYTSSRTRARNWLLAARGHEDTIQLRLKECVTGKGYTAEHIPVWLALARAAAPGSEARTAAQLDAKMCYLLDRAEHHARKAQAAWNLLDAVRGHPQDKSSD